uniref:Uncharacterized protein n=1 Tax=Arundo donax TaxID=35708 RepID=A0A0A9BRI0_ARUDO
MEGKKGKSGCYLWVLDSDHH